MFFRTRGNVVRYNNEEVVIRHKIVRGSDVSKDVKNELYTGIYLDKDCICILERNKDNKTICAAYLNYYNEGGEGNVKINRLWVRPEFRKRHYATELIYFALSSYKKINTVNLKACADNELCQRKNAEEGYIEPLTQRELEAFYDKFTYGSNSKMKIHFSRSD